MYAFATLSISADRETSSEKGKVSLWMSSAKKNVYDREAAVT
ncbi:hypothetical protein [Streptomyces sp. NPDC054946]